MLSLIQKHAHVKEQRSNHHIFKFQPNPSWAKKRPNRYTSFGWISSNGLGGDSVTDRRTDGRRRLQYPQRFFKKAWG